MFKSKKSIKNSLILLGLLACLIWLAVFSFPDNKLHLVFCDVGQGDATLIMKGFNQILIDAGPNDKVLTCLKNNMPFWDRTIEIVALTHPEADHMTGMIPVMEKYEVEYLLSGPEGNDSAVYQELVKKISEKNFQFSIFNFQSIFNDSIFKNKKTGLLVFNPYTGNRIRLGEIILTNLWPEREWVASRISKTGAGEAILGANTTHTKLNDFSLVFLLEYRGKKILLMGDADSRVQDDILQVNNLIPIDILKFPHHGSKTGISEEFLEQIKPKEAVISVGKNSYGHPTRESLDLLEKFNVVVRRTDMEGEIHYNF